MSFCSINPNHGQDTRALTHSLTHSPTHSTKLFSLDEAPWRVTFAPARVLALVLEVGLRVVSGEGGKILEFIGLSC